MPEQAPDGSIIITPKEFYDGVRNDIGEIKDSVSALREELSPLPARVSKTEEQMEKFENRIDRLEARMAWWCGAAAAVGAAIGTFAPIVFK